MKIKFNSNDDLPSDKTLGLHAVIIVSRFVFNDGSKYYPQALLDECLNKIVQ